MYSIRPIGHLWKDVLAELIRETRHDLIIASPYITKPGFDFVDDHVDQSFKQLGRIVLLTDMSPLPMCQGSTDPSAIQELLKIGAKSSLYHLPKLHAKVYVSDEKRAIITSGNLTAGGLFNNHEYSIFIDDICFSSQIHSDIINYTRLGAVFDHHRLIEYCKIVEKLRRAYQSQTKIIAEAANNEFQGSVREAEDELIRARLSEGPIHTVFQKTIVFLLNRSGPLSTEQLHPLIEEIHPDLCDNSIDRVIDGKRFGKKWKHAVRTAQQILKHKGTIVLELKKWRILRPH